MQLNIPYMDPMGMEAQPIWRCISLFDVVIFQPVMWVLRGVITMSARHHFFLVVGLPGILIFDS